MKNIIITLSIVGFMFANNVNFETASKAQKAMMQIVWQEAMEAKEMYKKSQTREEIIDNLASTAPREEFIINVDLGEELLLANPEATVYLSTDNQNSWTASNAYPLNSEGYENTWEAIINNNGSDNISWYIAGAADSEPLGFDYGRILVSQTPFNGNNSFPPPSSHYALLAEDPAGDASSNQDVLNLKGTYSNDKIFMSLGLNGGCCDEGSFFGPWYLYGVAIVNPEAETAVAYAIGYGDGGFGQLSPGLYKITGDLATGEIGGFDYVTGIDTNTGGNNMQASTTLQNIIGDPDWGTWPNSFDGFIALGVTVSASLDGFDVAASLLDQTAPGLMLMTTQTQSGNTNCIVDNLSLDVPSQSVAIDYSDYEGNLPWFKKIQLCQESGACFYQADMIASDHTYIEEGTIFRHTFTHSENPSDQQDLLSYNGPCILKVAFADGEYQGNQFELNVSLTNGLVDDGTGCLLGDANGDNLLNVLDVVGTVNAVLGGSYDTCIDINGDNTLNVLDIVSLVNLILG